MKVCVRIRTHIRTSRPGHTLTSARGRLCINNHDSTLEGSINIVDPGGINIAEKTCWVFFAGAELTILTCKRR